MRVCSATTALGLGWKNILLPISKRQPTRTKTRGTIFKRGTGGYLLDLCKVTPNLDDMAL